MIARIHDRMPAILRSTDYERWLGSEPDPRFAADVSIRADEDVADLQTRKQSAE